MTRFGERRLGHFDLLRWISHRHGFGHFIQFFQGEYSFTKEIEARLQVGKLIERTEVSGGGYFRGFANLSFVPDGAGTDAPDARHFGLAQQLRFCSNSTKSIPKRSKRPYRAHSLPRNQCSMS